MLSLGQFATTAAKIAATLASQDSLLTKPYLAGARLATNSLRSDFPATICSLDEAFKCEEVDLASETPGFCHPPTSFKSAKGNLPRPVTFPRIRAITLEDQCIDACSSFPYDPNRNCFYVDQSFAHTAAFASQAGGHLVAHGKRLAIVRRRMASDIIESGLFFGGNGSYNYYHWLLEIVSKLQALSQLPKNMRDIPLLVSRRVSEIPSFSEALNILAPGMKLRYLNEGKSHFIRRPTFISSWVTAPFDLRGFHPLSAEHFLTNPAAVEYLRRAVLPRISKTENGPWPERIFLARGNQRTYNQEELVAMVEKQGFFILYPERHSFLMQAGFFANAKVLVGPTGAAWANVVFADQRCNGLCWMPEELGEFAAFSNIAGIVGMNLRYLIYPSHAKSAGDIYRHSYRINPELFRRALDTIVAG